MSRYRSQFPDVGTSTVLSGGGPETLVVHEGLELPHLATFRLLEHDEGRALLDGYYRRYADLAREHGVGILFETPTRRASPDWGQRLGYDRARLGDAHARSVEFLVRLRDSLPADQPPVLIGATIGPRFDEYRSSRIMSPGSAERYHGPQVAAFADSAADFVSAQRLNYASEAIGIAQAARKASVPVVIAFTVGANGKLPTGQTLGEAIAAVELTTEGFPAFYMIDCAHPAQFADEITCGDRWTERLGGLRCNAAPEGRPQRDASPETLGAELAHLGERLPNLMVFGGCCGTDHRHLGALARARRGDLQ